mmetsp:Transcript_13656/g.24098  ORF Transcript_13656/g.24098 Transcript_13656/m.24098 type:complete len:224 (-) Transcript_13656:993-1664(-)
MAPVLQLAIFDRAEERLDRPAPCRHSHTFGLQAAAGRRSFGALSTDEPFSWQSPTAGEETWETSPQLSGSADTYCAIFCELRLAKCSVHVYLHRSLMTHRRCWGRICWQAVERHSPAPRSSFWSLGCSSMTAFVTSVPESAPSWQLVEWRTWIPGQTVTQVTGCHKTTGLLSGHPSLPARGREKMHGPASMGVSPRPKDPQENRCSRACALETSLKRQLRPPC